MNYGEFIRPFERRAHQFGNDDGVWGHFTRTPTGIAPVRCEAEFFGADFRPTGKELFELRDGWLMNTGFESIDGQRFEIATIRELLSTPAGQTDITIPGGPQHYVQWEIPNEPYSIWSHGHILTNGNVTGTFSHSQWWAPPEMKTNAFWRGAGSRTRLAIAQREEWWDDGGGSWGIRHLRTAWAAFNLGTIFVVEDDLNGEDFGLFDAWAY